MIKTRFSLKKIADLAILGLAVSIPSGFYFLTLPFLVVLALCRTAMKDERWKTGDFKTPVFILPAAFYLYVVIQFFFSHNKGEALSTLSSQLPFLLYPLILGGGKRLLPQRVHATFKLKSATPYPSGVVGLHYERDRQSA